MKEQLEKRLQELKVEFESGQRMLAEQEAKMANLRESLLRINGAIQVLEEELASENQTLVKITESDWPSDFEGAKKCMGQTEGWTHFLCCLKAYLEYGINLRVGGVIK